MTIGNGSIRDYGMMVKAKAGGTKGILNPRLGEKKFSLSRYLPGDELAFFVEHYWIVRWDLRREEPYLSETLPYPSVHLVFEQNNTRVVGVMQGRFSRCLEGKGQVLGVKFRPGAFYPFLKAPVSQITNKLLRVDEVFGVDIQALEKTILESDDAEMVRLAEGFLNAHLPRRDEQVVRVNGIVNQIIMDRNILKVDDVVRQCGISKRQLQRLFSQYVGISPKWVIQRYRLHEAAEQLAQEGVENCAKLALELGYFDQAHFIKDFKMIVGQSPAEYARNVRFG